MLKGKGGGGQRNESPDLYNKQLAVQLCFVRGGQGCQQKIGNDPLWSPSFSILIRYISKFVHSRPVWKQGRENERTEREKMTMPSP